MNKYDKYIYVNKKYFIYRKYHKNITITKSFLNKVDALCYKFIQNLKLKSNINKFNKSIISYWRVN
tara:strand:- start:255 stop:452 length:198 start_codon:yes stop_codon:yes gene_type:complete